MTIETHTQSSGMIPIEPAVGQVALSEWVSRASSAHQLMVGLVDSFFVPAAYKPGGTQNREVAIANGVGAILLGQSLGVDPLTALQNIYVIKGRPGMYAKFKVALAQSKGHEIWTDVQSDTTVTVCGRRRGSERVESVTITIEQAKTAGWFSNDNYVKTPGDMLWARCASRVADRVAGNDLFGIPSIEDLEDGPDDRVRTITNVTAKDIKERVAPPTPAAAVEGRQPQLDHSVAEDAAARVEQQQTATTEPAPEGEPKADLGSADELIDIPQNRRLHGLLRKLDLGAEADRAVALTVISYMVKRPIESTKLITKAEAGQLLDRLDELSKRPEAKWRAEIRFIVTPDANGQLPVPDGGDDRG